MNKVDTSFNFMCYWLVDAIVNYKLIHDHMSTKFLNVGCSHYLIIFPQNCLWHKSSKLPFHLNMATVNMFLLVKYCKIYSLWTIRFQLSFVFVLSTFLNIFFSVQNI